MHKKQNLLVNTSLYLIPVLIGSLLPLLTLPIFTRYLTVHDFGIYALTQAFAIFINGVSNFGLTTGYERNYFEANSPQKQSVLLYSSLLFLIISFIFFGITTYFFKEWISKLITGDNKYGILFFLSYCQIGAMSLKTLFLTHFKNNENAKANVWYTIDENLIGILITIILIICFKQGIYGLIIGPFIASTFIFIILCYKFSKILKFSINIGTLKSSLKMSLPLTPRIFFGVIGSHFDKYMIGLIGNISGVGIYNLGQKIANILYTFMTALQNVFSPQVYKLMFDLKEKGGRAVGLYLTPYLYFTIGVSILVSQFSEEVIMILTPQSFYPAIDIVSIFSILFSTYFFGKQPQLIYSKKTGIISALTLLGIALNIIINIPFIRNWGILGAAYGTLFSGIIIFIITFIISQKHYKIEWEYSKIITFFIVFIALIFLTTTMRHMGVNYYNRLLVKILGIFYFIYIGWRYNILNSEMLNTIKNVFMKAIMKVGLYKKLNN